MDPVIGVIMAAALGALGSYLAVARKLSGKINTSDATELWNESRSIREWSAERIATLTAEVSELEQRVEVVEGHNLALVNDKAKLLDQIQGLMKELEANRKTVAILTKQLNMADDNIQKLEQDIVALEGKRRGEVD
jgi:chromosome segregation ATPase